MIVEIHSENPELMSIIQKNPDSFQGVQLRELKNGVAIGRICSPHDYHMVFQDTKYSFCGDRSSQIDYQSYCNPRAFLSLINIFLRNVIADKEAYLAAEIPWLQKKTSEVDSDEYETTITVRNVYADGFNLSRGFVLAKYFPEISFERKIGCLHSLEIRASSVFRAVNLANLAMMYIAATNEQPWYINKDIARKYIRIAKNLAPVPYFVLYLFARRCLPKRELFEELREELESATDLDVELKWGNTQVQRLDFIRKVLVTEENNDTNDVAYGTGKIPERCVLEIGCGEMDYPRKFLRNLNKDGMWISSDLNDYSHIAEMLGKRNEKNLVFVSDLNELPPVQSSSVMLAIEVIEHMPYDEAVTLMANKISHHKPDRVIITTPNFNFNQYYAIEKYRHDDHHFELTTDGLVTFVNTVLAAVGIEYEAEFVGIGDRVGDDYMSLGCVVRRVF